MSLWKEIIKNNIISVSDLADFLKIENKSSIDFNPNFPLNIPLRLAQKMAKNDLRDPIVLQFLPLKNKHNAGYSFDPLDEVRFLQSKSILKKYQNRALLLCTKACGLHCRYCFRQHSSFKEPSFEEELKFLEDSKDISEIILSGGDPLALSNSKLNTLFYNLNKIPHLKRIRLSTRFPIGIPERIDEELLSILEASKLQVIFTLHCNHEKEFDEEIFKNLHKIQRLGIPVISQSVLLKDVNDSVIALKNLFELLIDNGILPYHLHQLDKVQGISRFRVPERKAQGLIKELRKLLPGYAIPRYVKEIAGEPHKRVLA